MIPLLLALACKSSGAGDDTGAAVTSPYSMPDRSGCTYVGTTDDDVDGTVDYREEQLYGADDALVAEWVESSAGYTLDQTWTRDAEGCLVAYTAVLDYDLGEKYDDYDQDVAWEGACDEKGTTLWREGTQDGVEFRIDYVAVYDGEELATVDATKVTDAGGTFTYRWVYTWADGLLVGLVSGSDGVEETEETWEYDDEGVVIAHVLVDLLSPEDSYRIDYGRDQHGRLATYQLTREGVVTHRTEYEWSEQVYHVVRTAEDDGADGSEDLVLTWTCSDSWPWTCEGGADGEPWDKLLPDGVPDTAYEDVWTCP